MQTINCLIVGVGGQGTLLAGKILGEYARLQNLDVKVSEVHGMARRLCRHACAHCAKSGFAAGGRAQCRCTAGL